MSRNVSFADENYATAAATTTTSEEQQAVEQQQQQLDQDTRGSSNKRSHHRSTAAARRGAHAAAAAASSSSLICPNCGGHEIEQHDASGASVCTACGVVVEENAIVSAVEFVEGAGGSSNMVGQFVSATSSKAYTGGPPQGGGRGGGRYGFSRDSRETTLANGRRRIQEVASRLRLGSHYVDAAHRLFTVAVEKNFVQGRRTAHVVAACLYIACRQEKSQHMLIDFSDALQINVYTLGTCFLKFRRLLGLKLEIIDPALYVYRFAAHLELDDKANTVALTALRLVARMKRDWIVAGRRPAGICAAALLIASRAHGFSKEHQDVTRILRVCGWTVSTRVKEFERTPAARLTLEQFDAGVDLQSESDPPIYTRNKIIEARARAIQDKDVALLESGALDDPLQRGKWAKRWREERKKANAEQIKMQGVYDSLEAELLGTSTYNKDNASNGDKDGGTTTATDNANATTETAAADTNSTNDAAAQAEGEDAATLSPQKEGQLAVPAAASNNQLVEVSPTLKIQYPRTKYGKTIVLPDYSTAEERQVSHAPTEATISLAEWKQNMPESIDKEIDCMFRSDEEERQMEVIFNKINKDYIVQQERKENDRLNAEAAAADQEKDDAAQAEGHARYKSTKGARKRKGGAGGDQGGEGGDQTTEEQLMATMSTRKVSRKINYDALSSIFDEDGSFSTDVGDAGAAEDPAMYAML